MFPKHVLSTKQFLDHNLLNDLFAKAEKFEELDSTHDLPQTLSGRILASLFFEPSTRTRFSFEVGMQKLGGLVISAESASNFSSAVKGESLADTIKIVSGYADVIVLRHYQEGTAEAAAKVSSVPVINAGDGSGEHPTQSLMDIYTIKKAFGAIDNLKVALIGDLLYGRTVHSLIYLLSLYKNVTVYLVSPSTLAMPKEYKQYLADKGVAFKELTDFRDILPEIDVLYVTRVQSERFDSKEEYEWFRDVFIVDADVLAKLNPKAIVMHPLPRVTEIAPHVDDDPRAMYFKQAKNGLYIRMAVLDSLLTK